MDFNKRIGNEYEEYRMKNDKKYLEELKIELRKQYGKYYTDVCVQYASKLLANNLPVIFDFGHLSLLLGIEKEKLSAYIFGGDDLLYKRILIPKKRGGSRELSIPHNSLKYIQRWILDNILNKINVSEYAKGFEKNNSIVDNAAIHLGQECIINMDLKDFFPSIGVERIFKIFYYYGYTKEVSFILAKLCTYRGILPQGSPASPKISNIVCLKLDKRLALLCQKYEANYSRYADDITISGKKGVKKITSIVEKIICDEGFNLNKKKTRISYKHNRQEVTGLNLNSGKVTVSKNYKRTLMQEIYYCQKYGVEEHLKHIKCDKAFYKEHLYGKAFFINMVESEKASRILDELDKIEWEY